MQTSLFLGLRASIFARCVRLNTTFPTPLRFAALNETRRAASIKTGGARNTGLGLTQDGAGAGAALASILGLDLFNAQTPDQNKPVVFVDNTYHFHVYSTKHNTHITLTKPDRSPIMSVSAGNIGFRKGARGSYDAAYQLTSYVFGRIQEEGLLTKINEMEVIMRGFGTGREAVTKAILGTEGRLVRGKIKKVTDATRLKFGGTRSPKPRRLG